MVTFSEHHEQWTLLGRHPELATQAVEEAIRISLTPRQVWTPVVGSTAGPV
jgi:hypothetical protein